MPWLNEDKTNEVLALLRDDKIVIACSQCGKKIKPTRCCTDIMLTCPDCGPCINMYCYQDEEPKE